ncbi:MAG TPA: autotransporter-associated beta strand repeat-containing protein [Verrucomicrobiae bacterium]|nr:autotransporter-associated beta strand repeat-containing protein [Verrucomicrobiae bacterium]
MALSTSIRRSRIAQFGGVTLGALAVLLPATTPAADIFWSGGAGTYNNAAAWGGVIPGVTDKAINDNGTANAVQINIGDPDWIVNGLFAGRSTGNGAFVQNGQTVYLTNVTGRGAVRLGVGPGRTGSYTLNDGNLNYTGEFNVGELGSASLTINGGTITGSGNLAINVGSSIDAVNATMDGGTNKGGHTWFEQGLYTADPTRGLPPAGTTIVSVTQPDHSYQFAPSYAANNSFFLAQDGFPTATITLSTPIAASALSFFGSSGGGAATLDYTIHFNGAPDESGSIVIPDWYPPAEATVAFNVGGRVQANGFNFQNVDGPIDVPKMVSVDLPVANTVNQITSITLTRVSGGRAGIMALSSSTGADFTPLAVTGYNADIVMGATEPIYVASNITNTLTQVTGAINLTGELWVGNYGAGVYNLTDGTNTFANWTALGRSGGNGVMTMTGGVVNKNGNGNFLIGTGYQAPPGSIPSGKLTHSGGTINSTGEFMIPENAPAIGEYNISGNAVLNVNNWMQVGRSGGQGLMNMTGGTVTKTGGGNFIVGDNATGVLNQSAGSISVNNEGWVGQGGSGNGTYNLSGGSFTVGNWIAIGRGGAMGVINLTNGLINKVNDGNFAIGSGGNGTINQYGGTISNQANANSITYVSEAGGTGTWNLYGGLATLGTLQFCQGGNGNGALYLSGGTLAVRQINSGNPFANATFVFNGGTLRAEADNAQFFGGLAAAYLDAGGAIIDSQTNNITIAQSLTDYAGGSVTKLGSGTLILSGFNNYSGATLINAGTLGITTDSAPSSSGGFTVANATKWAIKVQSPGAQLNTASATFNTGNATLEFDLGTQAWSASAAPLNLSGNLAVNGTVTVNVPNGVPSPGQFPLIKYSSKSGAGNFVVGTLPVGVVANLVDNVANGSIDIVVTSVNLPRWEGQPGADWDIGISENWINQGTGLPTSYGQGNAVLFDDNATGSTAPNLVATVTPSSVTFNNSAKDYTLTGSGKISGSTGLTKQGTAATTIATANDYTGKTVIAGGTLSVANLANGGSPSPIGASSASAANLEIAGGTLNYTGPTTTINRGYRVGGTNSGLSVNNNLTLSGAVIADQSANFIKSGLGQLSYTGAGSNVLSGADSSGYWVQDGAVRFDGVGGAQTNVIPGGLSINGTTAPASVVLTNTTVFSGGNVDLGNVPFTTNSLAVNSDARLNVGSWFILGDGGEAVSTVNLNGGTINNLNGALLMGGRANTFNTLNINGGTLNRAGDHFIIGPGNWNGEGTRTGIVNQVAGTVDSSREIWVGQAYIGYGEYNLSGGTINQRNWMSIGREGATGVLNMTGGALNRSQDGTAFIVADRDASIGTFNQSAGAFDSTKELWVGHGRHGERGPSIGVYNLSGGTAAVHDWVAIGREGGNGTFNMTGGTFTKDGNGDFLVADGNGSIGTLNHTGGTINSTKPFLVPQDGDLTTLGTYNVGGSAVLAVGSWFAVGRDGGVGEMNMTNGFVAKVADPGAAFIIGASGPGTFNQYGGTVSNTVSDTWIGENSSATWSLDGGLARLAFVHVARNGSSVAVINQNGGVIEATEIAGGSGNATVNFNGGTIRAAASPANFLHDLDLANVLAGGLTIDSGANTIGVAQALLDGGGNGGLTKVGTGTLNLNGANSYTGPTLVNAGTLGGNGVIAGPVSVAAGATLSPGTSVGTLTINNTLTLAGTSTTVIELNKNAGTNDLVAGVSTLTYGGTLVLQNLGGMLAVGDTFNVFDAATFNGSFSSVVSVTPGQTVTWDVSQLNVDGTVKVATAVAAPAALSSVVNGNNLDLSWPAGWRLEAQTNSLATGLNGNWGTVPGSEGVNSLSVPIVTGNPAVFYRLVFP